MIRAKIIGTGGYVPPKILTNADFEKMVDTTDEWIKTRTGISERHVSDGEDTSDLCVHAAHRAFEMAGVTAEDIDLIIAGTVTPDYRLPSLSCIIQQKLGAVNATAMDVVAACAGFIYGLSIAQAYIATGAFKRILIFGAETLSSITNYEDRNTCVLFGDGAGAAIVAASDDDSGVLSTYLKSDGTLADLLNIPGGGVHMPYGKNGSSTDKNDYLLHMSGNEIYKHAVRYMGDAAVRVVKDAGLEADGVDWLVPHQANIRIIKATAKRVGVPMDRVYINIEKYGNTSAASVPIALDEAFRAGLIKRGQNIVIVAFGGGLTWGAAAIRW